MPGHPTPHDDIVRVIECFKAGLKTREIVEQTGVKIRTVQLLIKKYKDGGCTELPTHKPLPGKPRLISPRTMKLIKRQVDQSPSTSMKAIKFKNPQLLGNVSVRTVQRRLSQDLGYKKVAPTRKPDISKKQVIKRKAFAKKYKDWTPQQWREVLWSDEATFYVSDTAGKKVWRGPDTDTLADSQVARRRKFPTYVMVWGCFGYGGLGDLYFYPKNTTVNQYNYYELLNDFLESSFERSNTSVFQQDGAPAHTAKTVVNWLNDCGVPFIKDWPGNSPDLSPIENLWGIMKAKLREMDTSTVDKLKVALQQLWDSFDATTLQNLADSVPRRLAETLKRKGKHTKY